MVEDISHLITDRAAFNTFVYTPATEALAELEQRQQDASIETPPFTPTVMRGTQHGVLFRQLITSNYDVRRFISILDSLDLVPLFWEYQQDKFTSNNDVKHALGKMLFYTGRSKSGESIMQTKTIVDFARFDGNKIAEVRTLWDEPLVEFHHQLADAVVKKTPHAYFDASAWCKENGGVPAEYYKRFLQLFVKNGILFDNFMLDAKEISFTRDVFLPSFMHVMETTGKKPLVVSLEPTNIEGDRFWLSHPIEDKQYVEERLGTTAHSM